MVTVAALGAQDFGSGLRYFDVSVLSNEPALPGESDILIGSGNPRSVTVRAERLGTGSGRVYTITASARDTAGNVATATTTCVVAHDNGKWPRWAGAPRATLSSRALIDASASQLKFVGTVDRDSSRSDDVGEQLGYRGNQFSRFFLRGASPRGALRLGFLYGVPVARPQRNGYRGHLANACCSSA